MRRRVSKNAQSIDEVKGAPIPTRPITKACRRECSACTNYHRCQYLWIERSRFWVVNTSCKVRSAPSVHAIGSDQFATSSRISCMCRCEYTCTYNCGVKAMLNPVAQAIMSTSCNFPESSMMPSETILSMGLCIGLTSSYLLSARHRICHQDETY